MKLYINIILALIVLLSHARATAQTYESLNNEILKNWTYELGVGKPIKFIQGKHLLSRKDLNDFLGCKDESQEDDFSCQRAKEFYHNTENILYSISSITHGPVSNDKKQTAVVVISDNQNDYWGGNGIPSIITIVRLVEGKISILKNIYADRLGDMSVKFFKNSVELSYEEGKFFVNGQVKQEKKRTQIKLN